jgi:hypothetical protein
MRHRRSLLLLVVVAGVSWSLRASTTSFEQLPSSPPPTTAADAPGAPLNLTASVQDTTVDLAWTAPITGGPANGYVVETSLTSGGPIVASSQVLGTRLLVTGVPRGIYFVHVRAQNGDGTSPPSNEVLVTVGGVCAGPPNPPGTLEASVTGGTVALAWSAPDGGCPPTGYVILAGSAPGFANVANASVGPATDFLASAPPGTYFVRVIAVNALGASAPSNEVVVIVTLSTVPAAPVAFSASASGTTAMFSWAPSPAGGAPTSYLLEATLIANGPVIASVPVAGTTLTVPNVPPGTYFVRVRGVNAGGAGPASAQQSVTIDEATGCVPGTPSPPSASVSGADVTISWNAVNAATSYRLDVGTAAGASNVVSEELTGTSRDLAGLSPGRYFMRVTAQNACGAGAASGEASFSIGVPEPTISSVSVTGPTPIQAGESQSYTATANFSNGSSQNVTTTSAWSSSNTAVATVSNAGVVTGVSAGSADIRATHQGVTGTRTLQVFTPTPTADFFWTTNPSPNGSGGVSDGQCAVTSGVQMSSNRIYCTFDARISTPQSDIKSYEWDIPVITNGEFSGALLENPGLSCGNLTFSGVADRPVTLRIITSAGTFSVTKTVTFVRAITC